MMLLIGLFVGFFSGFLVCALVSISGHIAREKEIARLRGQQW